MEPKRTIDTEAYFRQLDEVMRARRRRGFISAVLISAHAGVLFVVLAYMMPAQYQGLLAGTIFVSGIGSFLWASKRKIGLKRELEQPEGGQNGLN